jgi:hypothetical protein
MTLRFSIPIAVLWGPIVLPGKAPNADVNAGSRGAASRPALIALRIAVPETTLKVVTSSYELYAPSADALSQAQHDVDLAREAFRNRFGHDAPLVAIVLFDSPSALAGHDFSDLGRRGIRFIPWLTQQGLAEATAFQAMPALGILVRNGERAVQVVGALPLPGSSSTDLGAGDVIQRINSVPVSTVAEFQARFDSVPAGASIELDVTRGPAARSVHVTKQPASTVSVRVAVPADLSGERLLSHEACHVMFMSEVDRVLGAKPAPGRPAYGHPAIPDWLDEGAATLCEPSEMYERRLDQLRAQFDQRIPFDTLLTMVHPSFLPGTPGAPSNSASISVRVSGAGQNVRTTMFYGESATLARFLWSIGGPQLLNAIVDTLAHGGRIETALAADGRVPSSVSDLEQAWRAWIQKK